MDPILPPTPDPGAPTPTATPTPWESLHPNARLAMRVFTALAIVVAAAVPLAVLLAAWDSGGWSGGARFALWLGLLLLGVGLGWLWGGRRWASTGFALDAGGLRIRRGVAWRSETLVPRSRVQHTDLNRGPLDRRLGLATLKVYTAGTKLASVTLDGLPEARAVALRDALVNHDDDAV
jgi:membrane protein YdbS with pleckstrin-like domain